MQKVHFARVVGVIKDIMKKKNINYKEISKKIELSESGFKKILSGSDCSLSKIIKICDVLDVPVHSVFSQAAEISSDPTPLTSAQRSLLNSDEDTYRILACLQMVDYDLKVVSRLLGFTKEKAYPHLRKLEEVGLIEWHKGDKIKSFAPLYYNFKGVPASQRAGDRLRRNALMKSVQPEIEKSAKWACRVVRTNPMRPELLEEMNSKILKLIEDYMGQNAREWELYPKKDMIGAGWVYASFPFGLEEAFGPELDPDTKATKRR